MNVNDFVENYTELPVPQRRAELSAFIKAGNLEELYTYTQGEHIRIATRILADADDRISDFIKEKLNETIELLSHEDPKVRMNTVQILGNTCAEECLDALIDSLEKETTHYALPSYLIAIGKAKNVRAKNYLENYTLRSEVDKHYIEEKTALIKARSHYITREKAVVRILPSDIIVLSTPNVNVTYTQCFNMGFKPKKFGKYVAVSQLKSFQDIYKMRAFCDAYIYLGKCKTEDLPAFICKREEAIHQRTGVTSFRLEVKSVSHKVRLDIIQKCVANCKLLMNSASAYSIEVMVEIDDDTASVFLNPLVDPRFSYRMKSIPASIAPGVAACVCAYASEFFNPDARVLDNFCGSGTMLFERGYYPHFTLTGVDINSDAIKAAQENNKRAFAKAQFHHMDSLKFTAKKYDEVITNMPFGLRVGSHSKNERLYKAFFNILPQILNSNGIAILYTHEKNLVLNLLKQNKEFELLKRATFESGGLYPAVYVLRKLT